MDECVRTARRLLNRDGLRRPMKRLSFIWQYEQYGPLIGPKKPGQLDLRWPS